ncbi:Smr/MutS family protein [bacterium]|nr:Smr/MutS family protein [bacterium]MBR2273725.1 Smr/MutS family protein [Alphaproteobacteria bacterium]
MADDESWKEAVKGVRRLKTNRHVDDIQPKEVQIRSDKVTTVTFDLLKDGVHVEKDDLTHMDGSLAKRFKREDFKIESVLDLHGTTEKDAYDKVCDFIRRAYQEKKRCVLVVTGKGFDDKLFSERGVLRQSVPNWLRNSEISSLILAYKNPSEALGGAGALYILLRRHN